MKKTIGILGGMGPLATADLFRKITLFTKAGCDNDHIRVYIDSNAQIPDRTAAILNGGKDPLPEMRAALHSLEACGASCVIMQYGALLPAQIAGGDEAAVSEHAGGHGEGLREVLPRQDCGGARNKGDARDGALREGA